ncbi:CD48 antigen-like [Lepidochelys kempii]|uniref:CD48 antigen-like n=1 Tax=Lepidochelys kempii TaxID=8472 RepID=UPI003C6F52A1
MGWGRAQLPLLALLAQPSKPQVNGILGGLVVLSVDLSPGTKAKEIEWSFSAGTGVTIQLAEFNGGKFERHDPSDRFQQGLAMYVTLLRIKALELGDSGVYEARVKIVPATVEDQAFLLAVCEPVPMPKIWIHSLSSTTDGCNVTLQCQASGREEVNVSWMRGNPPRGLGDSERYQLAPDGRTLRLSLQPNRPNSTFTCTASNPGDQKSISPDLQSICQSGAGFNLWSLRSCSRHGAGKARRTLHSAHGKGQLTVCRARYLNDLHR